MALSHESLYHKLYIGISSLGGFARSVPLIEKVEKKVLLWQQAVQAPEKGASDYFTLQSRAYLPVKGSPAYFLVGELMSGVRYVKARRRGRHLTCWRFLASKVNAALGLTWWERQGGKIPERLNTWEYVSLDRAVPENERLDFLRQIDCRAPSTMDRAVIEITRWMVERLCPGLTGEDVRAATLANDYLAFIERELEVEDA